MGISKRTYEDITQADLDQYQENKFFEYMKEVDESEQRFDEWKETVRQQEDIICEIIDEAEKGSELESYCTLKEIRKLLDEAIEQIEPLAMQACDLESPNNQQFTKAGFQIQKKNGGRIIDYSSVPEIAEKIEELNKYKNRVKHALLGLEKGATMLSDGQMILADGECVNVPKYKFKKDSITVKKL